MPHDARRLAAEVEVVDEVLRVLGADLAEVKVSVAPVPDDLGRFEAGLAPLPGKLDALLPKVDELAECLDGMREALAGPLDGYAQNSPDCRSSHDWTLTPTPWAAEIRP